MNSLRAKVAVGFARKLAVLGLLLFVPAWSLEFWEAWVFLFMFAISHLMIVIYFLRTDPKLVERRLVAGPIAEKRRHQKLVMLLLQGCFCLMLMISGYDHRFQWSQIPANIVIGADVAVLLGIYIQFQTFRENSFASAVIAMMPEQKVIATGPYAVVRHPMYSGGVVANLFMPIALGSWRGLPFSAAMALVVGLRILDEEKMLRENLAGYEEYCRKVRWRIVPGVW